MQGVPVFRGTRVSVQTLFEYLEGRDTLEDFVLGFPTIPLSLALEASEEARGRLMRLLVDECVDEMQAPLANVCHFWHNKH